MLTRSIFASTILLALAAACSDTVDVTAVSGRLEPMDVDFGKVQVGIAMPYTLVVKNVGTGSLRITNVEVGTNFSVADYEFKISDASAFALSPSDEKAIGLSFQPFVAMEAPVETFIKLSTDATDTAGALINYTIRLSGQGIISGLEIVPNPVDFGTVLVGSSRQLDVTIKNTLSVDVDVISRLDDQGRPVIVNQAGLGRFEIVSPVQPNGSLLAAGAKLASNQTITIQARYIPDPAQEGREDRGKWSIANCDNSLCDVPVVMIGKGTNAAIECTPSPIAFGDVNPGVTATRRTTCKNVASETVTVTGWRLDTGSATEFSVIPYNGTPSSLEPNAEFAVETQFSPQLGSIGQALMGNLVITGRNPRANRDLSPARLPITGRAGGPDIAVLPARLDFGQVAIGTVSKKRLIIENQGFSDLTVTMVTADADGTNSFTVDHQTFAVARGDTYILEVSYRPLAPAGATMSRLIIASDDTDEPSVEVLLEGVGVDLPPCSYTINPAQVNFGITQVLRSTTQGVRVENTGTNNCLINDIEVAAKSNGMTWDYDAPPIPPIAEESYLASFMYWRANYDRLFINVNDGRSEWEYHYAAYDNPYIWDIHKAEIKRLTATIEASGARLIVVIFPNMVDPVSSVAYADRVQQAFNEFGVTEVLKLTDEAAAWGLNDRIVSHYDSHASVAFHHRVGQIVEEAADLRLGSRQLVDRVVESSTDTARLEPGGHHGDEGQETDSCDHADGAWFGIGPGALARQDHECTGHRDDRQERFLSMKIGRQIACARVESHHRRTYIMAAFGVDFTDSPASHKPVAWHGGDQSVESLDGSAGDERAQQC